MVEAVRLTRVNAKEVADWCGGRAMFTERPGEGKAIDFIPLWVEIPTLEGLMRADEGDYVIRGVKGEFYPCKPAIFLLTYEAEYPLYSIDRDGRVEVVPE